MSYTLPSKIIALCQKHQLSISTCESVTCGLIASYLGSVSGASHVLKGGIVAYQTNVKEKLVCVQKSSITKYGTISEVVAQEMALNTNKLLKSDICISITGNAGPNPAENKPIGMAYVGLVIIDQVYWKQIKANSNERNQIRLELVNEALEFVYEKLKGVCHD
ncbi:MAG: CinA family protein [Mycoplasma sp.]